MSGDILQPWQKPFYDTFGIVRLHEEIDDFCNYIKPTILEQQVREYVAEKIKNVILNRWPTARVHIFGSFATGLYLPTSDIDMAIFGEWTSSPLWNIDTLLRDNNIATNIRVIDSATVPIVKFYDIETGIQVDICVNKDNGVNSIPIINDYLKKYPNMRQLFIILKQFMLQRDLNEVFTGGMGSYCLILMCISFMQHYNRHHSGPMNIGCLLMEFFELYGRCFNFMSTAISVNNNGKYTSKYTSITNQRVSLLSITDPIESDNDVARSCFGLYNIRSAFANAYCKLYSKTVPTCIAANNGSKEISHRDSILGSIISLNSEHASFRHRICTKFAHFVNHDPRKMDFFVPSFRENKENVPKKRREKKKNKIGIKDQVKVVKKRDMKKKSNKSIFDK